jgi:glycine cleavage system P protein (glycine dehydrogenase) subunit 1
MLAAIGASSVEELFERQIPEAVRLRAPLDRAQGIGSLEGMSEQEVYEHLRELAARNVSAEDELSFLGAGFYDHYVPALIDMLTERSEFLTPYTPYQPEISQGGLQAMFEYQTAICELTALPVANASVYEGPSAVASAGYLAKLHNGRGRFVVSAGLHPHTLATLRTYAHGYGIEVVEVPVIGRGDGAERSGSAVGAAGAAAAGAGPRGAGATDPDAWAAAIDERVSAAIFAQPNFYGAVEDAAALSAAAKRGGGEQLVSIAQVDPIALSVLAPPGECGVDVAVGEGQPLGNRLDFGGPSFGFVAATETYLRRMPGRIAGETTDVDGRRGFVLTLQTREQHIRREKATSNICTAQALNALAGVVYLAWLGRAGFVELGELLLRRTHYARQALCALEGVAPLHCQPVVREFALRLDADVPAVRRRCLERGVNPGADLHALTDREQDRGGLLVAITERRSRADVDRLVGVLGEAVAAERAADPPSRGAPAGGAGAGELSGRESPVEVGARA